MVLENYLKVQEKIKKRTSNNVLILPVSKTATLEQMEELYKNGITTFAENRVEGFFQKQKSFPNCSWHMIGNIQSRKVKDIVGNFSLIHSLHREKIALEIDKYSRGKEIITNCLVQVNISKEDTKSGLYKDEVEDFLIFVSKLPGVNVQGLMTMAPFTENPEEVRYVFRELRELRDGLRNKGFHNLKELSMGMSNDYLVAVEEGATIVRIGSEIFS
ncbi:YggS family pyridoxal phosphate-dependent enzyme [Anaerobranca gottschalkii]|uniref:Pyridoxal phosphate homeostasis protein n=1 Tax=Anaerobranca gottschalkii DSM 13577 TaxID=1120990 RepID=A0A1H9YXF8_9FIRM|nr:YggS family pyridoxal phosphate-dependent enzyme [Anaerobranca gottschalkii]SES73372.1 hypothetical protein SAMN03080614_100552 [Anaerobranca gottschalkii DSM 13577]